jgi:hypothetical protein
VQRLARSPLLLLVDHFRDELLAVLGDPLPEVAMITRAWLLCVIQLPSGRPPRRLSRSERAHAHIIAVADSRSIYVALLPRLLLDLTSYAQSILPWYFTTSTTGSRLPQPPGSVALGFPFQRIPKNDLETPRIQRIPRNKNSFTHDRVLDKIPLESMGVQRVFEG